MSFIPEENYERDLKSYIDEAGNYELTVKNIEKSYSNGKTLYKILLHCEESDKLMRETLWETEKAQWRICCFLKACSVQIKKGTEVSLDDGSYIGLKFKAEVAMSEPNEKGNRYAEIKRFGEGDYDSLFLPDTESNSGQDEVDVPW